MACQVSTAGRLILLLSFGYYFHLLSYCMDVQYGARSICHGYIFRSYIDVGVNSHFLYIYVIVCTEETHLALDTVYPKKYTHGFCFAVLCCGYILTDFPISIRLTSLALWQSIDCPSASKATLMNMDKYFMWIHYERLHNHNKAKHNKTVCIFLGIYCSFSGPFYLHILTLGNHMLNNLWNEISDPVPNINGCLK